MRLAAIAIAIAALVGCGRMNPMNPDYSWDGEEWDGGDDTGLADDSSDTGDTGLRR